MDRKKQYRQLCKDITLPYYMNDWWLDTVSSKDAWDVALSIGKDGAIQGAMPYLISTKMGLKQIRQFNFTTYQGVYIKYPHNIGLKEQTINSIEKRVLTDLINALPDFHFFDVKFDVSIKNWLPFYWKGFKQTTRYTYTLPKSSDLTKLFEAFKKTVRTDIRKAEDEFSIQEETDTAEFSSFLFNAYEENGIILDSKLFLRMDKVLAEKNKRVVITARDKEKIVAGLYIIFDDKLAHCVFSAQDKLIKNRTPLHLVFWTAMQKFIPICESFDFQGSMVPEIEHSLRSYGANLTPYMHIYKSRNKLWHSLAILINKFP